MSRQSTGARSPELISIAIDVLSPSTPFSRSSVHSIDQKWCSRLMHSDPSDHERRDRDRCAVGARPRNESAAIVRARNRRCRVALSAARRIVV
jgi:hypothetical protein